MPFGKAILQSVHLLIVLAMNHPETSCRRALENDPQYFGIHLNMAEHNAYLIFDHVIEKCKQVDDNKAKILKDEDEPASESNTFGIRGVCQAKSNG